MTPPPLLVGGRLTCVLMKPLPTFGWTGEHFQGTHESSLHSHLGTSGTNNMPTDCVKVLIHTFENDEAAGQTFCLHGLVHHDGLIWGNHLQQTPPKLDKLVLQHSSE